jgi:hypothetical protein
MADKLREHFSKIHIPHGRKGQREQREWQRFQIPGATISYQLHSLLGWRQKAFTEKTYPLLDLSKGGLAFLTDSPTKSARRISLLLLSPKEDFLRLEGRVKQVSPMSNNAVSNRYRVGVQFEPFGHRPGWNAPDTLKVLERLEQNYVPSNTA